MFLDGLDTARRGPVAGSQNNSAATPKVGRQTAFIPPSSPPGTEALCNALNNFSAAGHTRTASSANATATRRTMAGPLLLRIPSAPALAKTVTSFVLTLFGVKKLFSLFLKLSDFVFCFFVKK